MAIKNEKYTIQNHTHSQAAVLSVGESQTILQNYKYLDFWNKSAKNYLNPKFIRFEDPQFGEFESICKVIGELVDYDENKKTGFLFTYSNNLFDDFQFLEAQILMEKYRRMLDVKKLNESRASIDEPGLVQLKENGGLIVDGDKKLQVDFSDIQPTLESEKNIKSIGDGPGVTSLNLNVSLLVGENQSDNVVKFKTINGQSLIYRSDDDNYDFRLATKDELDQKIAELIGTGTGITFAQFLENQNRFSDELTDFKHTVSAIQSQVVEILDDMQNQDIGIGGNGTVGCVIANNNSPSTGTCDDIVLQASKSYYIKVIDQHPMSSCIDPTSDMSMDWFGIDATSVTPTSEFDKRTVKFILEFRVNMDDHDLGENSQKKWRFPWTWSRGNYCKTNVSEEVDDASVTGGKRRLLPMDFGFASFCFPKDTVSLIEITGIWKCGCWNFFGKVIDQYYINCDEPHERKLNSNLLETNKITQDFKEKMEDLISQMTSIDILFNGDKIGNTQVDTDAIQMKLSNVVENLSRVLTMASNLQKKWLK